MQPQRTQRSQGGWGRHALPALLRGRMHSNRARPAGGKWVIVAAMHLRRRFPIVGTLALLLFQSLELFAAGPVSNILWYRQPAKAWTEALPLGNGRLGAMVFGGVTNERIQCNEISLWSGWPEQENDRAGA